MYSDMEEEDILLEVSDSSDGELCRQYNLEQSETLLLKAFQLTVKNVQDWGGLARESKHLSNLRILLGCHVMDLVCEQKTKPVSKFFSH